VVMPSKVVDVAAAALAGIEAGRRPTTVPAKAAASPELSDRPRRRTFTVQDKLRILGETDRAAESGAFDRISARAELVDQHQRAIGGRSEHLGQILDVSAESRQAGKDRLFVADVGVDVVKDGDPRTRIDWRRYSGLDKRRKKSKRF